MKKDVTLKSIEEVVEKVVKKNLSYLDAKIDGLTEVMVNRFEEVDEHFDRVENQLDRVSDDIRLISTHVGLDLRRA